MEKNNYCLSIVLGMLGLEDEFIRSNVYLICLALVFSSRSKKLNQSARSVAGLSAKDSS